MGLGNFFDNFMGGLAFGMLANNPFFGGMGCFGYGGRSTQIIDFGTFANPFPNYFGNMQYSSPKPISILSDFANPAYPTYDFSHVGQTIWDNTMNPDSDFSKRMREYYNNLNNNQQNYTYQTYTPGFEMPFSQFYFSNYQNPYMMTYSVQQPAKRISEPEKTDAEIVRERKNGKKDSNTEITASASELQRLKGKNWYEMTDREMQQVYGNYSHDITKPYDGTEEQLNSFLKGKGVLEGKGNVFLEAQKKYGISAAVLAAITAHESGHGKSNLAKNKNNVGGVRISGSSTFRTFSSVDECIMYMAKLLKNSYVDNPPEKPGAHLTKLYQINARYCPASDPTDRTNGNAGWAKAVANNVDIIERIA